MYDHEDTPLFVPQEFAEVRITVRLPAWCDLAGEARVYEYTQMIPAGQVRMTDPRRDLPHSIERAYKALELSLRLR